MTSQYIKKLFRRDVDKPESADLRTLLPKECPMGYHYVKEDERQGGFCSAGPAYEAQFTARNSMDDSDDVPLPNFNRAWEAEIKEANQHSNEISGTPFHYSTIDFTPQMLKALDFNLDEFNEEIHAIVGEHEVSNQPKPKFDNNPIPGVLDVKPEVIAEKIEGEGRKNNAGKVGGFWLIPQAPLFELAKLYATGAQKYEPRNWEEGIPYSAIVDAAYRHLGKWLAGEKRDQTDGQHHLASVAWCMFALMEYERTHPEKDDIATSED